MDGLTYKIASEALEYDWKDNVALADLINRLGHYENTGLTPEQLTEIDKLYAEKCREVAELRKQQRWISVEEKLPAIKMDVLVTYENGDIQIDFIEDDGDWFWEDREEDIVVVAWMPLPESYKPE